MSNLYSSIKRTIEFFLSEFLLVTLKKKIGEVIFIYNARYGDVFDVLRFGLVNHPLMIDINSASPEGCARKARILPNANGRGI